LINVLECLFISFYFDRHQTGAVQRVATDVEEGEVAPKCPPCIRHCKASKMQSVHFLLIILGALVVLVQLAKKYHPDSNPNDAEAEKNFRKVSEAYETLGNPQKRQTYDAFGRSSQGFGAHHQGRSYEHPSGNQQWSYQSAGMNAKDAEEMFKKIFHDFGVKGNFKAVNFGGGGFPKSGSGVFNSIFNNMMQGFGAKLAEEVRVWRCLFQISDTQYGVRLAVG